MKVVTYTDDGKTNFGDDLNRWLWTRLLDLDAAGSEETCLLGIGTVISKSLLPHNQHYIVLGSGIGYDAAPDDFGSLAWSVLAVRGPLTAKVLGLDPDKAVTDAALLLRLLPECEPLPQEERSGIAFMPHYSALDQGNWKQVCERAGLIFLDPYEDSEITVQRIRRSRLVIADAMHAAIVADALRVPWVPLAISPLSNTFKWLDWTLSLGLPYEPLSMGASTVMEALSNLTYRLRGVHYFTADRQIDRVIHQYRRTMQRRQWKHWRRWSYYAQQMTVRWPERFLRSRPLQGMRIGLDRSLTKRAVRLLEQATERKAYLSDAVILNARLRRLEALVNEVREELQGSETARVSAALLK